MVNKVREYKLWKMTGRNVSPVIKQGERKPDMSTYMVEPKTDCKELVINCKAEYYLSIKSYTILY